MRPDYSGGSLVNLIASIVASRGGKALHSPLRNLRAEELRAARNVVLLIVDGLGDNYLMRRGAGGELARRRRASLTSVFPSTTASAITTSYTGRTPLEHGLTGWFTYFGEAGCVAAALPFKSRGDHLPLARRGVKPEQVYISSSIFEGLPERSIVVTYKEIIDSEYNTCHCRGAQRVAYETLDELVAQTEAAVKSSDDRKFIYAYWPVYDMVSHRYGAESAEAFGQLEKIDAAFGSLLARLAGTDSLVIATADHGFIDVAPEESFELPQSLAPLLRLPLCGERRVAYCHVHDAKTFIEKARDWLGERADVMPSENLVHEGWFGPGTPHPRFAERIGDVALVMRGHYTVKDWTPGESRHLHIGNHGGTSDDEMRIPLILETT
ncbi:MAG TPA: alkaline phosphatase family protein [Burkholderiales bacterium]|nr:alkaline phosphatase family protein [Burkholderiales bacterium]